MNPDFNLIVMLTHNDMTVENAYDIFENCKHSKAKYWGIKQTGLPRDKMKELCAYIKKCGKISVMEVVAYTESECVDGAKAASECGCDILMGTLFYDSVNDFCKSRNIKYMPFVGEVKNRPSVLEGSVCDMIKRADEYLEKGAYGIDLLGYRYKGDSDKLIHEFVSHVKAPVCVAGSIDGYSRIDNIKESGAWAFTVGGAFFENKFGASFEEQIDKVCSYIENGKE